jgi:hypothetical protein
MKALSIAAGFIGLAAVSSAAAIRSAKYGVELCTERDFKSCTQTVMESDNCSMLSFVPPSSQHELTSNS